MGGDVAARLLRPVARPRRARHPHRLGKCLVDVARRQPQLRSGVARLGAHGRLVGAVKLDKRTHLPLEAGPPAVFRVATAELRPQRFIFGGQLSQTHWLVRRGDDRRHRRLVLGAEAVDQQILEIAERNPTIDRTPCREGDDERIGAAGETLGALARILDLRQPLLQRGDPCTVGLNWCGSRGRRWLGSFRQMIRRQGRDRGDASDPRGLRIMGKAPYRCTCADENEH